MHSGSMQGMSGKECFPKPLGRIRVTTSRLLIKYSQKVVFARLRILLGSLDTKSLNAGN